MAYRGGGKGGYGGGASYGGRTEQLSGMVKSYNRKGFGFIMCQSLDVDIYFSRESVAPVLQTSDLAGEYVTFDIHRFSDGKMQARNVRPVGECGITRGPDGFGGATMHGKGGGGGGGGGAVSSFGGVGHFGASPSSSFGSFGSSFGGGGGGGGAAGGGSFRATSPPPPTVPLGTIGPDGHVVEDRSLDWYCKGCSERNFSKRFECFKCKTPRPMGLAAADPPPGVQIQAPSAPRRTLSPHAGSRAMAQQLLGGGASRGSGAAPERSASASRKRSRSSSGRKSSSSSESSSDRKRKRRRKKDKKRKQSSSSSGDSSVSKGKKGTSASAGADIPSNPEIEKAKSEVLEKLMKIKQVEGREQRMKDWRALLREWHPDKNPDKPEVATAVFQFLQKGKLLIDAGN